MKCESASRAQAAGVGVMRSSEGSGLGEEARWTGGGQVALPSLFRGLGSVCAPPLAPDSARQRTRGLLCALARPAFCLPSVLWTQLSWALGCLSLMLVGVVSAPVPAPGSPARCPRTLFPRHLPSRPCSAQQHLLIAKLSAGWNQTKVFYGHNLI